MIHSAYMTFSNAITPYNYSTVHATFWHNNVTLKQKRASYYYYYYYNISDICQVLVRKLAAWHSGRMSVLGR